MKKQEILDRIKVTPEKESRARETLHNSPLEKNDVRGMILAAYLTFALPTILVIGFISLIMYLIFFL